MKKKVQKKRMGRPTANNKVIFIYKAKDKGELEDEEIKTDDLNSIKILNEEEMNLLSEPDLCKNLKFYEKTLNN